MKKVSKKSLKKKSSKKKVSKKKVSKKKVSKKKRVQLLRYKSWYIHAQWIEITHEDYQGVPQDSVKIRNVKRFIPSRLININSVRKNIWPRIKEYEQAIFNDIELNTNGAISFSFKKLIKIKPYSLNQKESE